MGAARDPRLAQIHCARRDLGLDEAAYRDVLERVTGERSAGALDAAARDRVIAEFRRLGWRPAPRPGAGWRPPARHAHQRKVYALWGELRRRGIWREPGRRSLDRLCERITGVAQVEWLRPEQSAKLIQALEAMRDHRAGGRGGRARP